MDITHLVNGLNPSGLDPELEKKADDYAKREWQMSFKAVLMRVIDEEQFLELEADFQNALFEHKYEVLLKAETTKAEASKAGKRWA